MYKLLIRRKLLMLFVWTISAVPSAFSQETALPLDPQVRMGKLDNGLTYYIRKNTTRPQLADFYIAQKVGSILETPNQRGLAHFLEHMAFNGTKHFPGGERGKGITGWCETVGIKFGYNLNAYTSVDETVYNISDAPVVREGVIDSCLLILHDWSNDLLLTDQEIDKERGVIHEEWRTRQGAYMRMYERALPIIYAGTKYADCLPIGNMDVVDHFKYQELRDYYEKWYRPDLQGIVIVGDVDPDAIEQKIRILFADVPASPHAAPRIYYPVTDTVDPIVTIETDKEMPSTQFSLFFKHDDIPDSLKNSVNYWLHQEQVNMICSMLNERLYALSQKADAPFLGSSVGYGNFFLSKTKGAFSASASCKEGKIEDALAATYYELLRAARYGFTESELGRIKQEISNGYESAYKERNTQKNKEYVDQYVRHFIDNEPSTGIEYTYENLVKTQIPSISLDTLNRMMRDFITKENRVLMVFGPQKEHLAYPTPQDLLSVMNRVDTESIEPYQENLSDEPLVDNLPNTGKIIEEKTNQAFGTTLMKLSNGMTISIKPTDFKADEVIMQIQRNGGNSIYPDSDAINWRNAIGMVWEGGLGAYSNPDLFKKLAGKQASVNPFMDTYYDGIRGRSTPRDLETMMQLAYLRFTSPREDPEANRAWRERMKESIRNQMKQPNTVFQDSVYSTAFGHNDRVRRITEAEIDSINYEHCLDIYRNTYADASDYTVRIVGNIHIDSIRPFIEKYLGALPSTYTKENWKETSLKPHDGIYSNRFNHKQEIPSARVLIYYRGKMKYSFRNQLLMNMLSQILSITYTEKVREEKGGTYGVRVNGWLQYEPKPTANLQIHYETAPDKEAILTPILYNEIERLIKEGPDPEKLVKVKEYMLKQHINNLRENDYWMGKIGDLYSYKMDTHTDYEKIIQSATVTELQKFAKEFFVQKNRMEVIMTDESNQQTLTSPVQENNK